METPVNPVTPEVTPTPAADPKAAVVNAANTPVKKVEVTEEVTPEQTPIAKRKIKWGEQEKEVSFDEAVQLAQKAFGIEEKARTVAQKADQADKILEMLQKDYKGFAKQCKLAGIDPQKLATEILYEQIRINSLTPEQKELEELKAQQAEKEAEQKALEDAAKKAEIDKKTIEWSQKFEKELQTALESKQLPMSRLTLALAAQYIDAGLAEKKEYTVEQVLPYVLRDLKNIHISTIGSLEGEALLNYIGEDVSNKVAAARVARYKKGATPAPIEPKVEKKGNLPDSITKLKGKAYWAALRRQKSEAGIEAFPGA